MRRFCLIIVFSLFCAISFAQNFSVSTNLVDWAMSGTVNTQLSFATGQHLSIGVSGRYNNWSIGSGAGTKNIRQRTFSADVRYWFWYVHSGWWLQASPQWCEYNFGGIFSQKRYEGCAGGLQLSAGYTLMLHEHFNIEFGAGLFGGYKDGVTYACPTCGRILEKKEGLFLTPDGVRVALVLVL